MQADLFIHPHFLSEECHERVAQRRNQRNLTTFLNFDFAQAEKHGERLAILPEAITGKLYYKLESININELSWKERLSYWYHSYSNESKVAHFVEKSLKDWPVENEQQQIHLETQYCQFIRKCYTANIAIQHPYLKILKVVKRYPCSSEMTQEIANIFYDRLSSLEDLKEQVNQFLSQPITLSTHRRAKIGAPATELFFKAVPKEIFKTVIKVPNEIADPTTESSSVKEQMITYTFQDPETEVISHHIWQQGQQSSLSKEMTIQFPEKERVKFFKSFLEEAKKQAKEAIENTNIPKITLDLSKLKSEKPKPDPSNTVDELLEKIDPLNIENSLKKALEIPLL